MCQRLEYMFFDWGICLKNNEKLQLKDICREVKSKRCRHTVSFFVLKTGIATVVIRLGPPFSFI